MSGRSAEEVLPIDIPFDQLVEWLASRQQLPPKWQDALRKARASVATALKTLQEDASLSHLAPAGDGATELDYFGLMKLHDQVKSELEGRGEAGKNFLGQYSNLTLRALSRAATAYRASNAFLGEAALALVQSAKYDIPALQKTVKQSEQEIAAVARKQRDYQRSIAASLKSQREECARLGISSEDLSEPVLRRGLLLLLRELPDHLGEVHAAIADPEMGRAIAYYRSFSSWLHRHAGAATPQDASTASKGHRKDKRGKGKGSSGSRSATEQAAAAAAAAAAAFDAATLCPTLGQLSEEAAGDGAAAAAAAAAAFVARVCEERGRDIADAEDEGEGVRLGAGAEVDWDIGGDGGSGAGAGAGAGTDAGEEPAGIDWSALLSAGEEGAAAAEEGTVEPAGIDWSALEAPLAELGGGEAGEGEAAGETLEVNWDIGTDGEGAEGFQVAVAGEGEGVSEGEGAEGAEAGGAAKESELTVAAPPPPLLDAQTRAALANDLMELDSFLSLRLRELQSEASLAFAGTGTDAPPEVQQQSAENVTRAAAAVRRAVAALEADRLGTLLLLLQSPSFMERTVASLRGKAAHARRLSDNLDKLEEKRALLAREATQAYPELHRTVRRTMELKAHVESELQQLLGRPFNLVGQINALADRF